MIWNNEKIIDVLRQRLQEPRFIHSLNVADSARDLALIYGADADLCYTAGLLHDITKNASDEEHLSLFEKGGVVLTQAEKSNKKLWHAMSGEQFVRQNSDIENEEIFTAVRYHTTGRAGMSLTEKIIYIADFISAERNYPDVDVMRALSARSLEEAMLYSLRYTIPDLIKEGQTIHPDSVELYNELLKEVRL